MNPLGNYSYLVLWRQQQTEEAADAAGRKTEHRGDMETSAGDEDKDVHKTRSGKTLHADREQKVKLGQRFQSKSNDIKSAKKEGILEVSLYQEWGKSNKHLAVRRADRTQARSLAIGMRNKLH